MKRKLFGIAKKRKEQKEKRENERANDIARKRAAIAEMQTSHRIVKAINSLDILRLKTDAMVNIAWSSCKIALCVLPIAITVAFTVKATLFILSLF